MSVEEAVLDIEAWLSRRLVDPLLVRSEIQTYTEKNVPVLPTFESVEAWETYAEELRQAVLDRVVFRGEGARWREAETKVEWLKTIDGGPGYRIRKLRYEALPGLWIPALLYEPEVIPDSTPVVLNVNGHDKAGKAAPYKQIRCINLARRGMLALNVEWLGMGQLRTENMVHVRMNQLDLCGTSGLAPFFLAMQRGLDVLLSLDGADPERVAVAGLSGGGWQTIFLAALDTRVTLANPVAGYTSFHTGVRFDDLGDSEQSPCDMGTVADYAHLTALVAPRPLLLTYNERDTCCFQAYQALPPLLRAAQPLYALYGCEDLLRWHVNYDPGTHNFDRENREAFYRMLGDQFYAGELDPCEIPSDDEVKSDAELDVDLPEDNADFHSLAVAISGDLPRDEGEDRDLARERLGDLVRAKDYRIEAVHAGTEEKDGEQATFWWFKADHTWTVPGVEVVQGAPEQTAILVADGGRETAAEDAKRLLKAGYRVVAVDPFYVGESQEIAGEDRAYCFALFTAALGDRPLGFQASQVAAIARWCVEKYGTGPVTLVARGPTACLFALVAGALEERAISGLELYGGMQSLKEVIRQNRSADEAPELFCFGLLEAFDIPDLEALVAPRPVLLKVEDP